jgi:hypothetical protein
MGFGQRWYSVLRGASVLALVAGGLLLAACAAEEPPADDLPLPPEPPARVPPARPSAAAAAAARERAGEPDAPAAAAEAPAAEPAPPTAPAAWRVARDGTLGCADTAPLRLLRQGTDTTPRLLAEARASGGCRTTFRVNAWALEAAEGDLVRLRLVNGDALTLWFLRADVQAP